MRIVGTPLWHKPRGAALCAALATSLAAHAGHAEPAPSFAELLKHAATTAPRLAEAEAGVAEAKGKAEQARTLPNPTVGLETEDFGGQRPFRGFSQAQTTLTVSQPIELGGKRSARTGVSIAELTAAQARQRQVRADFAYDLALAYATAEAADLKAQLAGEALRRADDDLRIARAMVQAGREANLRLVTAQAAAASARADLEAGRADAAEALGKLSALAGTVQTYTSLGSSLLLKPATASAPQSDPPRDMPAVLVAEAEREAARRLVTVERRRAVPDITAMAGVRRLEGEHATDFVAGLSAPLPLFDRNRGNVSAASARAAAAEARLAAARLDADAAWRAARSQRDAALARLAASSEFEAAAQEAYRLTRIGYEGGRTPLAEVLNAQRGLTDARTRTLDARLARVRTEASLARAAGQVPFGATP